MPLRNFSLPIQVSNIWITAAPFTYVIPSKALAMSSLESIRQPIDSNDDIANAFDGITYVKGAAVIQMFETWIGKEKFRKGIQLYLKQHANGNATAADFEAAISSAAGRNIAPAFDSFLDQAGVPEVSATLDCTSKPKLKL